MAAFTDLQLDSNGDLLIQNGDLVLGLSDADHLIDIAVSYQGEWRQFPDCGIGYLGFKKKSFASQELSAKAIDQYKKDGYKGTPTVSLNANGELDLNLFDLTR